MYMCLVADQKIATIAHQRASTRDLHGGVHGGPHGAPKAAPKANLWSAAGTRILHAVETRALLLLSAQLSAHRVVCSQSEKTCINMLKVLLAFVDYAS